MTYLNLRIGDAVATGSPSEPPCAQRGEMPDGPAWFVLKVMSMRERDVEADLRELGVDEAWHPTEVRIWFVNKGPRKGRHERTYPAVPGYVLFRVTGHPRWDLLVGERAPRGVIEALGGVEPVRISETTVAQMAQVPGVLAEIVERERRKNLIEVGCMVEVIAGALTGSQFTVLDLTESEAHGEFAGLGRMAVSRTKLRKVV